MNEDKKDKIVKSLTDRFLNLTSSFNGTGEHFSKEKTEIINEIMKQTSSINQTENDDAITTNLYSQSKLIKEVKPVNKELQDYIDKKIQDDEILFDIFYNSFKKLQEIDPMISEEFNNNTIGFIFDFQEIFDVKIDITNIYDLTTFIKCVDDIAIIFKKDIAPNIAILRDIEDFCVLINNIPQDIFEDIEKQVKLKFINSVKFDGEWKWN